MIRRFFYHSFWNFYDHMGTLILWGAAHALLALGLTVLILTVAGPGVPFVPLAAVVSIIQFALAVVVLSALLPYCARAARGEPARFQHVVEGLKQKWASVLKIATLILVAAIILVVNLNFYLSVQKNVDAAPGKLALVFIVALVGWTALFLYMFLWPWLCAATSGTDRVSVRTSFKKGLMAVAVTPATWLMLGLLGIILAGFGAYTRIGLILVIPLLVSFGQTAYFLSVQFADFLAQAKNGLGDASLGAVKKRAKELSWEWEYRQPRRTFKELIKPWDY